MYPSNNLIESVYPREECGVFAIYGHEDASRVTFSAYLPCSTADRNQQAL